LALSRSNIPSSLAKENKLIYRKNIVSFHEGT
jgi:hypothetical protein